MTHSPSPTGQRAGVLVHPETRLTDAQVRLIDELSRDLLEDPGVFFVPPRCAYTAQVPRLFSNSLRDNILMGLDADDETLMQAVHQAVMEVMASIQPVMDRNPEYRAAKILDGCQQTGFDHLNRH